MQKRSSSTWYYIQLNVDFQSGLQAGKPLSCSLIIYNIFHKKYDASRAGTELSRLTNPTAAAQLFIIKSTTRATASISAGYHCTFRLLTENYFDYSRLLPEVCLHVLIGDELAVNKLWSSYSKRSPRRPRAE